MIDIEALIWIEFKHCHDHLPQLSWVSFLNRWKLAFSNSLKQIIKGEVFFIVLTKWTSKHAYFISNTAHTPNITLPIITLSLKNFRAHIKWGSYSWKSFKSLWTKLSAETQISHLQVALLINKNVCRFQIPVHYSFFMHVT